MYQAISQIPIKDILDKLGIKYSILGSSLGLWDGGVLTDGRRANVQKNYIHDFSGKNRASGESFPFVKAYLKIDSKSSFAWFHKNFPQITSGQSKQNTTKIYRKRRNPEKLPPYVSNW